MIARCRFRYSSNRRERACADAELRRIDSARIQLLREIAERSDEALRLHIAARESILDDLCSPLLLACALAKLLDVVRQFEDRREHRSRSSARHSCIDQGDHRLARIFRLHAKIGEDGAASSERAE